jgi:hypothetical protein
MVAMVSRHRDKQSKTQQAILKPHDGLRVLARIIARVHLEKSGGKEQDSGINGARKY